MKKVIIEVKDLSKSYNGRQVVKKISFSVEKGEIFGILGPNGAGKSTTLEMLEALRPIDGGTAVINDIEVAKDPLKSSRLLAFNCSQLVFMTN